MLFLHFALPFCFANPLPFHATISTHFLVAGFICRACFIRRYGRTLFFLKGTYFSHSSPPFSLMPSPPAFSKKPPTAPHAVLVLSTPVSAPADPPDYAAQLNSAVKRNEAGIITAVLRYLAFASALLGYVSSTKSLPFPLPADRARYLGFLNLVSTCPRLWLLHLSYSNFFSRPSLTKLISCVSPCRPDFSSL